MISYDCEWEKLDEAARTQTRSALLPDTYFSPRHKILSQEANSLNKEEYEFEGVTCIIPFGSTEICANNVSFVVSV